MVTLVTLSTLIEDELLQWYAIFYDGQCNHASLAGCCRHSGAIPKDKGFKLVKSSIDVSTIRSLTNEISIPGRQVRHECR